MGVSLRLLLVIVLFLGIHRGMSQSQSEVADKSPTFSLHISAPQQVVKAGSKVRVDIELMNLTDHTI